MSTTNRLTSTRSLRLFVAIIFVGTYLLMSIRTGLLKSAMKSSNNGIVEYTYTGDEKISVIIMSYGRPRVLQQSRLLPVLTSHEHVDEILLLHANQATKFEHKHPKVRNIDAVKENDAIGLGIRFEFCDAHVKEENEWVLIVDDDMELDAAALTELIVEFSKNPNRIVGKWGRRLFSCCNSPLPFYGYNTLAVTGKAEVVLTKFMMMQQTICKAFADHSYLVFDDIVKLYSKPLWNGEDIFMSLVANHLYSQDHPNNYAMPWLNVWESEYSKYERGISGNVFTVQPWSWGWWKIVGQMIEHKNYRGYLWREGRKRLMESGRR